MDIQLLCLVAAVLLTAQAMERVVYFKLGGEVTLLPAPVPDPITSVSWKHNEDLVAEFVENIVPLEFYGGLNGRATMNLSTGELRITNMIRDNRGVYAAEINDERQDDTFRAVLLNEVPTPTVMVSPLVCSSVSTSCILTCDGVTTGAEPVTYSWRLGDMPWEVGQQEREILNEENRPATYSCRMTNPVSERNSPVLPDPFSKQPQPPPVLGIVLGVFAVVVVGAGGGLIYFFRNTEPVSRVLTRLGVTSGDRAAPHSNGGAVQPEANDQPGSDAGLMENNTGP